MGEREIRDKYGGKLDKAINRAIRAELLGGNEALDRLTTLAGSARHSLWKDKAGKDTGEAAAYFKHKKEVVDRMAAEIRRKWGLPPAESEPAARGGAKRSTGKPRPAGRRPPQGKGSGPGRRSPTPGRRP